ncbi:MAG: hypothetical protein Q7R57_06720 [Dehalococcoidales bacterium]|nr:hypothetical protein [Dehalococcoidales bacterium]
MAKTRIFVAGLVSILLFCGMPGVARAEQSIKIFGYVTADADAAVKNMRVTVSSNNAQTGENGYYELLMPYRASYDFFIEGRDPGDPYLFTYIPVRKTVLAGQPVDLHVDFKLRRAANLLIQAYDGNGALIRNKDFQAITNGEAYATGPDDLPHYAVYYPIHDSYSISRGPKSNASLAIPAFVILPGTTYKVYFLWEIPEFGKVMLFADNEGKGYSIAGNGGHLTLNLNFEAAKSRVAMLGRDYDLFTSQGLRVSADVAEGLKQGREHLRIAETMLQSPSPDMKVVVQESNLSLKYSLFAHEQLYLDKAKVDIEKYRKGSAKIRVVDTGGKPLAGQPVFFKQTSRDFMFSATPDSSSYSRLLKDAGINSAKAYLSKYGEIEPEPNKFDWRYTDNQVNDQARKGLISIGNLGWFFFRGWGGNPEAYFPAYLKTMSFEEVKKAVYDHAYAIVSRYKGKVDVFDAIYEECNPWSNELKWTWSQRLEILKTVTSAVRAANPQAKIRLKDGASPYNHFMSWSVYEPMDLNATAGWVPVPEFITVADSRQIPIDIIGLEFPNGGVELYQTGLPNIHPTLDLVSVSTLLGQYARFNKPIMLTDYHAPSTQIKGGTWWHRPWDEQTQAEYATGFYTMVFSSPLARGIDWGTGVTDDLSGQYGGLSSGLLHADLTPKPAYFALKTLINSWTTSGSSKTNEKGGLELRGFGGDYEISLETPTGEILKKSIHISEQQTNEVTVEFPVVSQKEAKPTPSSEPVVSQPPKATPLPEPMASQSPKATTAIEESHPTATSPPENLSPSESNKTPLIAGIISGTLVLGLFTLFVVRRKH